MKNRSIIMPSTKSIIFGSKVDNVVEQQQQHHNFYEAIAALTLPTKIIPSKTLKKSLFKTNIDLDNPFHKIQVIDLSGFRLNCNRQALKEFLESIQDMRTLQSLNLSHNGINDSYFEELKYILTNTSICVLDLSNNEIGPKGIEVFLQQMKEIKYFKSLNLQKNSFSSQTATLKLLSAAVHQQTDMYHIAIDSEEKGSEVIQELIVSQKSLRSVDVHSTQFIDLKKISQSLQSNTSHLCELTLKFCFLKFEQVQQLCDALTRNTSLVYLNLQQNALNDRSGQLIAQMIEVNYYLHEIDLEHNQLGDHFIQTLSKALRKNNVLDGLKLGFNIISCIKALIPVIGPENQTLKDLTLGQNQIPQSEIEHLGRRIQGSQDSSFTILSPINFSVSLHRDIYRVWNI